MVGEREEVRAKRRRGRLTRGVYRRCSVRRASALAREGVAISRERRCAMGCDEEWIAGADDLLCAQRAFIKLQCLPRKRNTRR